MNRDGIFRTAGGSDGHGCVEVAADAEGIRVRDSKDRAGGTLRFSDDEWQVFTAGAKAGEFDL